MSNQIVCPTCGTESVTRTRGIPSWHTCKNGHTYKADDAHTKAARAEILRLTQELEAAEAKGREARNAVLEEVAVEFDKRAAALRSVRQPHDGGSWAMAADEAERDADRIRALKAPAIGSQGTEKGRG